MFFVGNPKEKTVEEIIFEETSIANIPNIDKFWNNSTVGVVSDKQEPVEQPVVQQVQQLVQKVIPQTQKPVQKIKTPKVTTKPQTQTKPVTQQKPATQTTKPQTTTKTTTTTQKPATTTQTTTPKIPQTTLNVTQNTQQTTTKPQTTTQPQTTTKPTTTTTQTTQQTQTNTAAAKQELANYKISLRNTIGRKIDFTKVVGDGSCAITFKVSSSGQLTNRAFSQQSSNITLNDAVYAAMKATPSFSAPPASYKGETLTLTIRFTNGNFAITLN